MKREDSFQSWAAGFKPPGRPMTHYDLLGLPLFESDTRLIREMVQKQLRAVWNYTNGPNAHQARKLRTKIDQSARCLLNARLKSEYDQRLRKQLGEAEEPPKSEQEQAVEVFSQPSQPPTVDVVSERYRRAEQESNRFLIVGSIAVFVAIALGLFFMFLPGEKPKKPPVDVEEPLPKPKPRLPGASGEPAKSTTTPTPTPKPATPPRK